MLLLAVSKSDRIIGKIALTIKEVRSTECPKKSDRWGVEDYHQILKSGEESERYRLAAVGIKTWLGFFSVIAVELLQVTYLHRTQPEAPAIAIAKTHNSPTPPVLSRRRGLLTLIA